MRATVQEPTQQRGTVRKHDDDELETVAPSTVADHYNNRREVGREAREFSPIIPLKRFNNWVKSALIALHAQSRQERGKGGRILELGCGKGGDLRKWDRQRPAVMVMVDLADVSVDQARQRYEEGHFRWPASFYAFDCFRVCVKDLTPATFARGDSQRLARANV